MKKLYFPEAFRKVSIAVICVVLSIAVLLPYCKKHPRPGHGGNKSKFSVMSNANDPLLVQARANGNTLIDIYGTRDEAGIPTGLTDIIIQSGKDTIYYKFDASRRLSAIVAPNGTQFLFTWVSSTVAVVTVLANDGVTQLTTEVDFSQPQTTAGKKNITVKKRTGKASLRFSVTGKPAKMEPAIAALSTNATITVLQCGGLSDAQVYLTAKTVTGQTLGKFPGSYISKGQYGVSLPTNIAPTINPGEVCGKIADVLGVGCFATEFPQLPLLCPAISFAITASGIGAPAAAPILAACSAAITYLELYCTTLGASPGPGAPDLASILCASEFLNRTYTADIILYPSVVALPSSVYGQPQRVSGNGPFPNMTVNLSSTTTIRRFELVPPLPAQGQSYVAQADVFCATAGSVVRISIVGTDGYEDDIIYNIDGNQTNGLFTLTVPGAETGIVDVVTLEITLPDGSVITRQASLVFGT